MNTITTARPVPGTYDTNAEFAAIIAAEKYRDRLAARQVHAAQVAAGYKRAYRVLWSLFGLLGGAALLQAVGFAISKADAVAVATSATATAALVFGLAACLLAAVELHQVQNAPGPRRRR